MQGVAEMFVNPIPETPRAPIAPDSDPSTIASWEVAHTNAAEEAVGVGISVGEVITRFPHPVSESAAIAIADNLNALFALLLTAQILVAQLFTTAFSSKRAPMKLAVHCEPHPHQTLTRF